MLILKGALNKEFKEIWTVPGVSRLVVCIQGVMWHGAPQGKVPDKENWRISVQSLQKADGGLPMRELCT